MDSGIASILKLNSIALLSLFIGTFLIAYLIAWILRDEYNPIKYIRVYGIYILPLVILGLLLRIPLILIFGIYLFGAVVLVFRNQHYFDK
ncbi:MAG: hypothetical protein LBI13_07535 [Streptococcaceae bacterium]|jgi:hypothetical protein|nr:hypothetical protein [Streptococcaceae bacterium]